MNDGRVRGSIGDTLLNTQFNDFPSSWELK